jgi:hypothetical protein
MDLTEINKTGPSMDYTEINKTDPDISTTGSV